MQAVEALIKVVPGLLAWHVLGRPGGLPHFGVCQVSLDRFSPPLYDTPAFTKQVSLTYIPDMPGSEASHGGDNDVEL